MSGFNLKPVLANMTAEQREKASTENKIKKAQLTFGAEFASVSWDRGQMSVYVHILDVRASYGRIDYLVSPIQGQGQQWVSDSKLTPLTQA